MEIGQIYDMAATDVSTSGEGIGRIDGAVTFVPGMLPGDEAQVEITGIKKNIARGKIVQMTSQSASRTEPRCPAFGRCGGCTLQNMEYGAQVALKEQQLRDKIQRIYGGQMPSLDASAVMEEPWNYRNKAEFAVGWGKRADGTRGAVVGFYDRGSRNVVEATDCMIQSPAANMAAAGLRQYIEESGISIYNERSRKGLLRRMIVRTGWESGEIMITLTINGKKLPEAQLLADIMSDAFTDEYELRSIALEYNTNKNIAEPGSKVEVIAGGNVICDTLAGMNFEISPQSFYQVNPQQTAALYQTVLDFAQIGPEDIVFDLYCGVGTIGIYCAKTAKYVWGIEVVKSAIIDANRNAVINGLVNIQFLLGKSEEKIHQLIEEQQLEPNVVILDPPRAGCRPELVEAVCKAAPERIVYVSCEPATMARDLKLLTESGEYELTRVKLVDQFCHTIRMEAVVLLTRKSN